MLKRTIDVVGAAVGLIVLSPVLLLIAVAVRVTLGSPIFFRQQRPGRHGEPFALLKFRTMLNPTCEADLRSDAHTRRITPFGRWLRSTSLDELPELVNVLRGDMSLVGPRPLLMHYLPLYSAVEARRHEVRPGLTGWAQINGRNTIEWQQRLAMDVWYVDNRSLRLDLKILWRTVLAVLRRDGINRSEDVTMPPFLGTGGAERPSSSTSSPSPSSSSGS